MNRTLQILALAGGLLLAWGEEKAKPDQAAQTAAAAADSVEKKAAKEKKAMKVFPICDPDKLTSLAQVDTLSGMDDEEKALCKERLKLLNPLIQ